MQAHKNNMLENKGNVGPNSNGQIKELQHMPDNSNQVSKATEQRLGAFVWDIDDEFSHLDLVTRGPCELDNGAIYHG